MAKSIVKMTIDERVALGAQELDEIMPDWFERIRPRRLDLSDSCNCVLGQLSGANYLTGVEKLFHFRNGWGSLAHAKMARRGFILHPREFSVLSSEGEDARYNGMTKAWRREIRDRRKAKAATDG